MLLYFNRLAADDFYFLFAQQKYGTVQAVLNSYEQYSGRWTAYSLTCWLLQFWDKPLFLPLFFSLTFLLFYAVVFRLFNLILKSQDISLTRVEKLLYSVLFTSCCLISSNNFGETWLWFTSVCSYWLSLIALLFLLCEIFSKKFNLISTVLLLILPIYIGGASESYALVSILIFILLLFYGYTKKVKIIELSFGLSRIKISLILILLITSFSITASAPGNLIRLSQLPTQGTLIQIISPFKALVHMSFHLLSPEFLLLLLFATPFYFLGGELNQKQKTPKRFYKKNILFFIILVFSGIFLLVLPASLLLNETPPVRALSQVYFFLSATMCIALYYLGQIWPIQDRFKQFVKSLHVLLLLFVLLYLLFNHYPKAKSYAFNYDKRMKILIENKTTQKKLLLLPPLGNPAWFYSAEISSDTNHFTNQHLRNALELPFPIALENGH
jgi:hypothetical protein